MPPASPAEIPTPRHGVRRATWRLDVTSAVPLPGRFEIAVDVIAPSTGPLRPLVLSALPGGFLSRRYFDLDREGEGAYSFAVAMARRGITTLAFDHVGTGESSKPDPIEDGYALGVEAIARANQRALELALERLAQGDPATDLRAIADPTTIGVGHSMGSCLTVEQQALARPHTALVLFSFSTAGLPAFLDPVQREYLGDPARARREVGEIARRSMGTPYPAGPTRNESDRRAAFGVGTAPAEAEALLQAASTNLLAVGGLLSMIPGGYAAPAQAISTSASGANRPS
ncbi:MAG TPA: alpha/beta fold hydrolase, partial [Myxococcota bacterium]|nr:alpha/beta fold hydrolase [Myxococcota bacterium]